MANTKISALTSSTTPLAGTEVLPIVQSGATVKVSVSDLTAGRTVLASSLGIGGAATAYAITAYGSITSTTGANYFAGTLGIGTTPAFKLDVVSGAGVQSIFRAGQSGISNGLTVSSDGTNLAYTFDSGNIVIATSGKGIDFSATSGSGTSELFADYEEGTWTPNQGSGLTVTGVFASSGTYTKIGRMVFVTARITASVSMTLTGGFICSNLPFAIGAAATGSLINSDSLGNPGSTLALPAASPALYASAVSTPTGSITYSVAYPV